MNSRITILAAIGGAALVAIPTTVAVAVTQPGGFHAPMAWHDNDAAGYGAHDHGMWSDDDGRFEGRTGDHDGMGDHMGMDGFGGWHPDADSMWGGIGMHGAVADPGALVSPGETLSARDADALSSMVNEEKLAHDLYVTFADAWGQQVFERVAMAEQQHTEAIRSLLDAYGAEDPTRGLAVGEFSEPELRKLYDNLVADGLTSSTRALEVAALVEETDISDLRDRSTESAAIDWVFSSLESASQNHLRAFVANLSRAGVDYEAQMLTDLEVSAITGR